MSKHGNLVHLSKQFEEDLCIVDTDVKEQEDNAASILYEYEGKNREMLWAMKLWLQEYLAKTGIQDVVIGVSGGVDSALSLYVLSQVLTPEHIHAIYMPTRHNSEKSLELSQKLASNLGISLRVGEIDELVQSFTSFATDKLQKKPEWITYENLQARIRWTILMNIANDVHGMVINNSNKTELALGYGTLYGDLIGGLSFIGDLNKREIYDMVRYINHKETHDIIPDEIITRKASAELADGQVDPFDYDKISDAVEELQFGVDIEKVAKKYQIDITELEKLKKRIKINEFKIRQAPPVIKLKERSVGIWRLYPIVE